MTKETWAILDQYWFEPVQVVRETEVSLFIMTDRGERRRAKRNALEWRGDEATARKLVERLTSAKAEKNRRQQAAADWFRKEQARILETARDHG